MDIFLPCERLVFFREPEPEQTRIPVPARDIRCRTPQAWRSRTNAHTYRLLIVKDHRPQPGYTRIRTYRPEDRFAARTAFAVNRVQQRSEIMTGACQLVKRIVSISCGLAAVASPRPRNRCSSADGGCARIRSPASCGPSGPLTLHFRAGSSGYRRSSKRSPTAERG
jgi:hypothetical protein